MAYRRVLCLAFSRRDGGHCFAGIDLSTGSGRDQFLRPKAELFTIISVLFEQRVRA